MRCRAGPMNLTCDATTPERRPQNFPPGASAAGVATRIAISFHSPLRSVPTGTLWRWTSRPAAAPSFFPLTHTSCEPARSRMFTPTDSSNRLRSCGVKKPSSGAAPTLASAAFFGRGSSVTTGSMVLPPATTGAPRTSVWIGASASSEPAISTLLLTASPGSTPRAVASV